MKTHDKERFEGVRLKDGVIVSDRRLTRCTFEGCHVMAWRPDARPTFRRIEAEGCKFDACSLTCAVFEESVFVDCVGVGHRNACNGTVFRHVVIRGKFGDDFITATRSTVPSMSADPKLDARFDAANAAYYAETDWALDISEIECVGLSLRGIPARVIRRDPKTQAVVRRERVLAYGDKWKDVAYPMWDFGIGMMIESAWDDYVLVAPRRGKNFQQKLDAIKALRDAGIADPD